ncbi:hypothetical protein BKG84_28530 [Mycobacteroides chelonae]|uniref:Uncharacterized protein n=1 Tax=Mycobacteroides chelonae TaxID=1774 RepID=A0A1S1LW79_MYCCH|nr:hypothetical protein BKG84_28530 [Mycobacteroides chelonae]
MDDRQRLIDELVPTNAHQPPAHRSDRLLPFDIAAMLHRIAPVLRTVELGSHPLFPPAHVETNGPPVRTAQLDLGFRTR